MLPMIFGRLIEGFTMLLTEVLDLYFSARDTGADYREQVRFAVMSFTRFLGYDAAMADLAAATINAWHASLVATHKPRTRRRYVRYICMLWRHAADSEPPMCPPPVMRKIVRVKMPHTLPRAWNVEEVRRLLAACDKMRGLYNSIPAPAYWRAYVLTAWDTGLRPCDLRCLEKDGLGEVLQLIQRKTGKIVRCRLRKETVAAIGATFPPERRLVWPLWCGLDGWKWQAKQLCKRAGLSGNIGRIRASSGTAAECASPGRGHTHLGNTRAVFEAHYLDARHVEPEECLTPPLIEEKRS